MTSHAPPAPIADATAGLAAWLAEVTGAKVLTGPPMPASGDAALVLWPLELRPEQATVGTAPREPLRLRVRHLVIPGGSAHAAAGLLDRIVAAAVAAGRPSLVLEPPAPQLWLALGIAPRLAVTIDVPASVVPPAAPEPLVREPLRIVAAPLRPLHGRVVGPGGVPLPGVRVRLASTGAATHTDDRGRFSFAAVPADPDTELHLLVKNRSLTARPGAASSEPVVIHCDSMEA